MPLDRSAMIAAALELLNEVGLEGLTLRRLAARLDVQAPALYWHFKNKQDLLDEMASTALLAGVREISPASRMKWDHWATAYGRGLRKVLLRYRDGAKMISGTRLKENTLYEPMELSLRVFVDAGFSSYRAVVALSTLHSYVVGFVIEEQAVHPVPEKEDKFYDPKNRAKRIDGQRLPLALKAGEYLFSRFDRRFEDGLKMIVAGIVAQQKLE
jgi:TetR/AcrR family transcriptional regulator, tetracycline repressor protein